jgi:hypothetical protein
MVAFAIGLGHQREGPQLRLSSMSPGLTASPCSRRSLPWLPRGRRAQMAARRDWRGLEPAPRHLHPAAASCAIIPRKTPATRPSGSAGKVPRCFFYSLNSRRCSSRSSRCRFSLSPSITLPVHPLTIAGAGARVIALCGEAAADLQMQRFKADRGNRRQGLRGRPLALQPASQLLLRVADLVGLLSRRAPLPAWLGDDCLPAPDALLSVPGYRHPTYRGVFDRARETFTAPISAQPAPLSHGSEKHDLPRPSCSRKMSCPIR